MSSIGAFPSDLTGLFSIFRESDSGIPRAWFASPEETPEPYRTLLAHDSHMTVTMEDHHGCPVNLVVISSAYDGTWYARKILLTERKEGKVVQFGLMRFNFDWCDDEIKGQILEGRTPLGRILIQHDVLRRISTHALMKITPNQEIRDIFGMGRVETSGDAPREFVYGRLATIFCNEEPAVDLLEIASPSN